jgi:hypothetical protein
MLGRPPPRGALLVLWGARVVCMRDILILNEIWSQYKTYIFVDSLLGTNILLLVTALAPNYKQHILLPAEVRKVSFH